MIRYNFIHKFQELAQIHSKNNGIEPANFTNKDFSILNKQLFEIIKKEYSKEIPYCHLVYSDSLNRDVIKYIPNKDLENRTFKKHGIQQKFTTDFITYANIKDIPMDNYILEFDSGVVENISEFKKIQENKKSFDIIDGILDFKKYYNNEDPKEAYMKMMDLDGFVYFHENKKGIYFIDSDNNKINGIIMLSNFHGVYSLDYVNVSNGSRNKGLALNMYRKMVDYVKDKNGILIRSAASDMGSAFIEKKITRMLQESYPNLLVLDQKTKDIRMNVKLAMSELKGKEVNDLKTLLKEINQRRSFINSVNVLGEFVDYSIPEYETNKAKEQIASLLNKPKKEHKNRNSIK